MRSVADALEQAAGILRDSSVDQPRRAAELLLSHVLGWSRERLIAHADEPLSADARARYENLVRRHAAGEPIQYLTGEREFFGLTFQVSPAVLIPRPETEILVEKAVHLARAHPGSLRFADIGTGSGCIAIALAHEVPTSLGRATDLSSAALQLARKNAHLLGVRERVEFIRCDLLEAFPLRPLFDLILSNPPYIPASDIERLAPGVRDFEPRMALHGGASGIETYRRLIPQAGARLVPGGRLLIEIGMGQETAVAELLADDGFRIEKALSDLRGIPRCLVARRGI